MLQTVSHQRLLSVATRHLTELCIFTLGKAIARRFSLTLEKCELLVYKTLQHSHYIHDSTVIIGLTAFLLSIVPLELRNEWLQGSVLESCQERLEVD